jgi:alpha-D-ribose 1-methylphosphonate 5-triphosphate diphosphatase PhnM
VRQQRTARQLRDLQSRVERSRESCRILEEQVAVWTEAGDELRLRALMSETPLAQFEFTDVQRHVEVARKELERRRQELDEIVAERDEMLREWNPKETT